jgi:tripartite-type tricarboxylate transporter receptor subunit TctC
LVSSGGYSESGLREGSAKQTEEVKRVYPSSGDVSTANGTRRYSALVGVLLLTGIVLLTAACGGSGASGSDEGNSGGGSGDYPNKDIRLIVQAAAGGTSDLVARTAAGIAEKELGTNIVVENRPGAAGSIAMKFVASQPPDGYTIGYLPVEVAMLEYLGYDVSPKDFALISQLNSGSTTLTVRANSPYESFEDFIAAAKERPGKLTVGNSGPGSIYHVATGAIEQETGVDLTPVPFDGGAPAAAALIAGDVDATTVSVGEVLPGVKAGDLRVLAVLSEERSPILEDVPTAKDLGYDISVDIWGGVGAPADAPPEVVDTLSKAFRTAVESEKFAKTLENTGNQPTYKGPKEFTEYVNQQSEQFSRIIPELEITQQ